MRIHDKCLPCVVNQAIKVADITGFDKKEELLREVFSLKLSNKRLICTKSFDIIKTKLSK